MGVVTGTIELTVGAVVSATNVATVSATPVELPPKAIESFWAEALPVVVP